MWKAVGDCKVGGEYMCGGKAGGPTVLWGGCGDIEGVLRGGGGESGDSSIAEGSRTQSL